VDLEPRVGGGILLAVRGEVDMATAPAMGDAVRDRLRQGPVVLDLSGVGFMDSSGVRMLDALAREAAEHAWDLRLRDALSEPVAHVLELTGVKDELPFEP
jgi:anti-sigma B factor antagonist